MKRLLLCLLLLPLAAFAEERILEFHSDIVVVEDGWIGAAVHPDQSQLVGHGLGSDLLVDTERWMRSDELCRPRWNNSRQ